MERECAPSPNLTQGFVDDLKIRKRLLANFQTINKVSQEEKNCETLHFLVGNQKENQRGRRIYRVKSEKRG